MKRFLINVLTFALTFCVAALAFQVGKLIFLANRVLERVLEIIR